MNMLHVAGHMYDCAFL